MRLWAASPCHEAAVLLGFASHHRCVVWQGDRVIDSRAALEAVVRHAVDLEDDYDDIAPVVTALAACGDVTLVPRLHEALNQFLDEENFYGRDLIASILAGIQGVAALAVLLRTSARDMGDDQDSLQTEIIELLRTDPAAGRHTALGFATGDTPELRLVGLWALGFVPDARDVELLTVAANDADPRVRSAAGRSRDKQSRVRSPPSWETAHYAGLAVTQNYAFCVTAPMTYPGDLRHTVAGTGATRQHFCVTSPWRAARDVCDPAVDFRRSCPRMSGGPLH
jgi:hypothetical protein